MSRAKIAHTGQDQQELDKFLVAILVHIMDDKDIPPFDHLRLRNDEPAFPVRETFKTQRRIRDTALGGQGLRQQVVIRHADYEAELPGP